MKKIEDCIAYLNFASKICIPYYLADIYNQLGIVYLERKEYKKSVNFLKKAYYQDTTKNEILFKIANTYDLWQKDKTQAIRYYTRFLNSKKEKSDYFNQLVDYAK
jgi:tetratricopeptide (TPR) repeat protein